MVRLKFDKPAEKWEEANPLGNGFLGAMVYGGVEKEEIHLNEDSLWSSTFCERVNLDSKVNQDSIKKLLLAGKVRQAEKLAGQSMFATTPHMSHFETLSQIELDFFELEGETGSIKDTKDSVILPSRSDYKNYKRELDIQTGVGNSYFELGKSKYLKEYFISNPDQVMVYHLSSSDSSLTFDLSMMRRDIRRFHSDSHVDRIEAVNDEFVYLQGTHNYSDSLFDYTLAVKVISNGGKQYQIGSRIVVKDADSAMILITARTGFRSANSRSWCDSILMAASQKGYEKLKDDHISDFTKLTEKATLAFQLSKPNQCVCLPQDLEKVKKGEQNYKLLEAYFQFGKYLFISSSREGSLPATLQGIWNPELNPIWGSRYTININIQMNYWLAERCDFGDLHLPLLQLLKKMQVNGRKVAKEMYGARGFCCHHNTDIWGDCAPQDRTYSATIWPLGGAWLSLHIMEHYRYTKDAVFLSEYFPVLKDCVLFFLDYLTQNELGEWITGPSVSPENSYRSSHGEIGSLCMGPAMDSQILYELFTDYQQAVEILQVVDELSEEVDAKLNGLPQIKVGKHGQIQEWAEDYEEVEPGHRHISQLFALYPGTQIRLDKNQTLVKAAEETLTRRLKHGGGHTGWSKAWIIHFFARLGKGRESYQNLFELLANSTLDNLFDNHPPFQIDGNFGGANGILETLVQDYEDEIWLLPAISENFPDGELKNIVIKAGANIDIYWRNQMIQRIDIVGKRKANFGIKYNGKTVTLALDKDEKKQIKELGKEL